jgi:hypothetical protein
LDREHFGVQREDNEFIHLSFITPSIWVIIVEATVGVAIEAQCNGWTT